MSIILRLGMDPRSRESIKEHGDRPRKLLDAIGAGITQAVEESAAHVKAEKLSGTYTAGASRGGTTPVALRSGALRQAIIGHRDQPLSGYVGVASGPASAYAATILGDEETTIEPKNAKHLWVPVGDNLGPSGQMRMSPREAMSVRTPSGKRALRIFKSKSGNLVAFLPGRVVRDIQGEKMGLVRNRTAFSAGRHKRGEHKGRVKGKLLFVLKDSVTIKGTNALAEGVNEMRPRITAILQGKVQEAMA